MLAGRTQSIEMTDGTPPDFRRLEGSGWPIRQQNLWIAHLTTEEREAIGWCILCRTHPIPDNRRYRNEE